MRLIPYLRAGYAGLYLVTAEEQRVEAQLKLIAAEAGFQLYYWSLTTGLVHATNGHTVNCADPLAALDALADLPEKSLILLKDFPLFLQDPNPLLLRKLKDTLQQAKTKNHTLLLLGCRLCLPPELERDLTVLEFDLPGPEQLGLVLDGITESAALPPETGEARDQALAAASGLTTIEAENAFALSVAEAKEIRPTIVAREKAQAVKKGGLLELIERRTSLDAIGGLDVLKSWLLKRRRAFSPDARNYGLPLPKGLLILGVAGTGKSQTAKATAEVFGVPLLKLDAGRLFAGLVGQSEANLRAAIQTAEAIAPCCLWVDELEKSFAGARSSGATDGGTSARVLGSFLSWMQEKTAPVFVVATANDVTQLPPELLRKGRFDEVFFVDLPNVAEREAIWRIVIRDYDRQPDEFDLAQLAKATEGLTGAEIRGVFFDALFNAFDADGEPNDLGIAEVLTDLVPLSKLMSEPIQQLRQWAKGRARPATSATAERKLRKLAV